ncbi:MAG TPA: hypothetical protein VN203_07885, partial [Candidatus Acidoferrum sp.]|nr:hypothetical protein [Candidatus Acidoferrum sp.]
SRRNGLRMGIGLIVLGLGVVLAMVPGNGVGLGQTVDGPGAAPDQAQPKLKSSADETARQVTVFAILATADPAAIDPRLASVNSQLRKVLPGHGFKLLDVRSKRIEATQSVTCDLGNGYKAETILVRPLDENGKVQLRCNLSQQGTKEFSTLVKTPINQLFFYERSLKDGTRVLIGVGARDALKVEGARTR